MSGAPSIRTNAFRFPPSSTTATHCGTLSSLAFATAASINSLANSAVIPCFSKVLLILKSLDGYGGKRPGFRAERWPPSLSRFNRIARAGATLRFGEACSDGGALCGAIRLQTPGAGDGAEVLESAAAGLRTRTRSADPSRLLRREFAL